VIEDLESAGVPSRPYFSPLHLQPSYAAYGYRPGDFPVAERIAASTLALPFSARLPEEDVRYVAERLVDAVERQFRS
jgi:dTDP-4-amino-4,6-dideoxygalactose transaminase